MPNKSRLKQLHDLKRENQPKRLLNSQAAEIFFDAATNLPIGVIWLDQPTSKWYVGAIGEFGTDKSFNSRLTIIAMIEDILKSMETKKK